MKVRLVGRRKQPCLIMTCNWGTDRVMAQKTPRSQESSTGKNIYLRAARERKHGVWYMVFCVCAHGSFTRTVYRERSQDSKQVKTEQAPEWEQIRRSELTAKFSMRISRTVHSEAEGSCTDSSWKTRLSKWSLELPGLGLEQRRKCTGFSPSCIFSLGATLISLLHLRKWKRLLHPGVWSTY